MRIAVALEQRQTVRTDAPQLPGDDFRAKAIGPEPILGCVCEAASLARVCEAARFGGKTEAAGAMPRPVILIRRPPGGKPCRRRGIRPRPATFATTGSDEGNVAMIAATRG